MVDDGKLVSATQSSIKPQNIDMFHFKQKFKKEL